MKMADAMDMKGRLIIQQFNPNGELVEEVKANNFIVYSGRDLVAKMFLNQQIAPIRYLAIGSGNSPVNPISDTALQQEVFRKEVKALDLSRDLSDTDEVTVKVESGVITQKNRKVRLSVDLDFAEPPNQPVALTEAGLFNSAEGGIMYNRVVFPNITKTADFKLTLVWEIIF
ncbi:hypothetical protein [Kamptonema sp. UHCC 0994]|uniref:hypothetical protein n=1 Tax=Kamptonema sp. UHCC 0994 TaxID=3031329 RepID=UPI0023B88B01|nr:hypothetical protein [Kamptonema sp. UHCC 0994]MDF0551817.1 hypothetical protein [Kamptonema sp. UHCC 0994]